MILVCPRCSARFLVPAAAFAHGPRQVRCARCGHIWQGDTAPEITVMPASNPPQAEEMPAIPHSEDAISAIAPEPHAAVTSLPAIRQFEVVLWLRHNARLLAIIAFLLVLLGLLYGWQSGRTGLLLKPVKQTAVVTRIVDGLTLQGVRSERRLEDAAMMLDVEGEIYNTSNSTRTVPVLKAKALGPDGESIESWSIAPPAANLEPGRRVSFQSTIKLPRAAVSEISLNFAGTEDDE